MSREFSEFFEKRLTGDHGQTALYRMVGVKGGFERDRPGSPEGYPHLRVDIAPYLRDVEYTTDTIYDQCITDSKTRRESIANGIPTWGAAGVLPLLVYGDDVWIATLYRDDGAPSWPNSYNAPAGLSEIIDGKPECNNDTAIREFNEELIFLDSRASEPKELDIPYSFKNVNNSQIDVYKNNVLMDVMFPFAIAWGNNMDTVTTVMYLAVMRPKDVIDNPRENLQVINGEVINGKAFSRDVVLFNFNHIYERRPDIGAIRYSTNIEKGEITRTESSIEESRYTTPLSVGIEKLIRLSDEELADIVKCV